MAGPSKPTHDLAEVQAKVRVGFVHYRTAALMGALDVELSRRDIDECVLLLSAADFHKTMLATNPKWVGCWQDVYKPMFGSISLYVKLQLFPGKRVYIVSFKRLQHDRQD